MANDRMEWQLWWDQLVVIADKAGFDPKPYPPPGDMQVWMAKHAEGLTPQEAWDSVGLPDSNND